MTYTYAMLAAMRMPDVAKTYPLYCDIVTNHGAAETTAATVAPSPSKTNSEGSAQQTSVPIEVNNDKYPNSGFALAAEELE